MQIIIREAETQLQLLRHLHMFMHHTSLRLSHLRSHVLLGRCRLTESHISFEMLKGSDLHIHDHVTTPKHYKTNTYYLHYTYIQFELPAIMTTQPTGTRYWILYAKIHSSTHGDKLTVSNNTG
jgi:hypothetical protein